MLTIKAVVLKDKQRIDQTYNIKVQFTLGRRVKRLSSSLFAKPSDLTKTGELKKFCSIKREADELVSEYQRKCSKLQIELNHFTLDQVMYHLKFEALKEQHIDFFGFAREWIKKSNIKGAPNYTTAINAFAQFHGSSNLDIREITTAYLKQFIKYLEEKRRKRVKKLEKEGKRIPSNRLLSLYLISLKRLYKEAQKAYNNQEMNLVLLPFSPFDRITIPKQEATRKRAITPEQIKELLELPYRNTHKGVHGTCRFDLAKDCFILSFCLIGMNSVDLFYADSIIGNRIVYNRAKTAERRLDNAKMEVDIPDIVLPIMEKYKDHSGKRLFNFYKNYADEKGFNKAINRGLKEIGEILGIEDLEFYAARHSWATIALNKCGIDKYTVHSALNHVDDAMKVTDIYIERDFVIENQANVKVLKYVFG